MKSKKKNISYLYRTNFDSEYRYLGKINHFKLFSVKKSCWHIYLYKLTKNENDNKNIVLSG